MKGKPLRRVDQYQPEGTNIFAKVKSIRKARKTNIREVFSMAKYLAQSPSKYRGTLSIDKRVSSIRKRSQNQRSRQDELVRQSKGSGSQSRGPEDGRPSALTVHKTATSDGRPSALRMHRYTEREGSANASAAGAAGAPAKLNLEI